MRVAIASLGIFTLLAINAYCPSQVWALSATPMGNGPCCPESDHQKPKNHPCDTSAQTCPYVLLQKSKAVPVVTAPPRLAQALGAVVFEHHELLVSLPAFLPNGAALYLRNRVLLI
ncbi:MAG TPA: hypothetical protein VHW24_19645 [Bryobacteraceae bacterium]|jgi:hypothetical protein|nr:hypothetical protein [Bryobacteraceae bacterium]